MNTCTNCGLVGTDSFCARCGTKFAKLIIPFATAKRTSSGGIFSVLNVYDVASAKKAIGYSVLVMGWIVLLNMVMALWSMKTGQKTFGIVGPWSLVDVALTVTIAWRVYRGSFPWAVAGLIVWIAEKCYTWSVVGFDGKSPSAIIFLVIYTIGYIAGVRGTWFLRKERTRQELLAYVLTQQASVAQCSIQRAE